MTLSAVSMPETDEDAVRAYSIDTLARMWGVSKRWVYDRINAGDLPSVEFGSTKAKTRVLHTDALAFLQQRRTG